MTKDEYEEALDNAVQNAGSAEAGWNSRFIECLGHQGLVQMYFDPMREDGLDLMAPVPYGAGWKYQYPAWIIPMEDDPSRL